jgi:hypothetical protein
MSGLILELRGHRPDQPTEQMQRQEQRIVVAVTIDSGQPDQRGKDDVRTLAPAVLGPDGKQFGDGGESG